jgi:WD40 repeat protein
VHGAPDHVVRLWDVISGELIQTFTGHENSIDSIAVSPDEMIIASASWDSIRIWHVPTGLAVHVFREDSPKYALAFSPKANFLAAASSKGIRIWLGIPTVASEDFLTYQGHASAIDALAFSPDGRLLISSDDHDVRLWEPDGPVPFRRKYTGGPIRAIAVNPIRSEVGLARLDANMVWDLSTGPLQVLRRGNYETNTLTFSPDGERMATGGRDRNRVVGDSIQGPEDSTVYLWDVASGKALAALSGHKNAVMVVRFTPEGKQIVSASLDKTVRIWEADGKALIRTLSGHSEGVSALAISPDGNIIATGSEDQTIRLWNRSTGALIRILATDIGRVRSLNFGADGRLLSGSSDTIHVWDVGSGTALAVLRADNSDITSVGWSPDQRRIVSASRDSVRLWDATRYEPVLVLRDESMVNEVAFLPSGKEIIAGTERGYALKWQAR